MNIVGHLLILGLTFGGIWFCAGFVVQAVDRLARRLNQNSFAIAFLVLGILTSLTETSVAINSTLQGAPHLSAGNLIGGSIVIFLLIIPALAFFGGGVRLQHTLSKNTLLLALAVIALPAVIAMTGVFTPLLGLTLIFGYGLLLFHLGRQQFNGRRQSVFVITRSSSIRLLAILGKIVAAGVAIFLISRLLVQEGIYVAEAFQVPASLVGLLMLSVGTNIPEITIAVRAILSGRKQVAFGNYIGSAAINTLLFGLLAITNGRFELDITEFLVTGPILLLGLVLFYRFARTRNTLSPVEGMVLGSLYVVFLVAQITAATLLH